MTSPSRNFDASDFRWFARLVASMLIVTSGVGCARGDRQADPAAGYPNRTVALVVPWAAGGGTDRVARFLADQLQRELHKPVVVVNQTGGSGASGHAAGARARADGYTITMGTFELSTMRAMGISDLTYRDFQPLMEVNADAAAILVRSDAPWQSLTELLDEVRRHPGKLKMSGTAAGGAWDLARAGLLMSADLPVDAVLWIPSQGSAPSLVELLGGHIDAVCCSVPEAATQLEAGELRVLCILAPERLPAFPQVKTAAEEGIAWEAVGWRGLLLPRGTPPAITGLLEAKLETIVASDAYRRFMEQNGFAIVVRGPEAFDRFLAAQEAKWSGVIARAHFENVAPAADPGPWFFPAILSICLAVGGLGIVGRWILADVRQARHEAAARLGPWLAFWRSAGHRDMLLVLVGLAVYVLAIAWLGFFPSTLVFATLLMVRLGLAWRWSLLLTSLMLLAIWFLFVWLFRVQLPVGPWNFSL